VVAAAVELSPALVVPLKVVALHFQAQAVGRVLQVLMLL
jgi:hypothetical protein